MAEILNLLPTYLICRSFGTIFVKIQRNRRKQKRVMRLQHEFFGKLKCSLSLKTHMKKLVFITIALFFCFSLLLTSCTYNSEEELYPGCDTIGVSYSNDLVPILQANCYVCHSESEHLGGVTVEGYAYLSMLASHDSLFGPINHSPGYIPMPESAPKLSDCDIAKFKSWIDNGYPNN